MEISMQMDAEWKDPRVPVQRNIPLPRQPPADVELFNIKSATSGQ